MVLKANVLLQTCITSDLATQRLVPHASAAEGSGHPAPTGLAACSCVSAAPAMQTALGESAAQQQPVLSTCLSCTAPPKDMHQRAKQPVQAMGVNPQQRRVQKNSTSSMTVKEFIGHCPTHGILLCAEKPYLPAPT